jgi:hypothetical protein
MTFRTDPGDRVPRGDKNRRIALGIGVAEMAALARVSREALHDYEFTQPDHHFDLAVAERIGRTLERLEAEVARPS